MSDSVTLSGAQLQALQDAMDSIDAILTSGSVEEKGHAAIGTGIKTCASAGTASQFSAQACKRVTIQALANNADVVTIGDASTVASSGSIQRGVNLLQGFSVTLIISNMNLLYIDAISSGDGVSFLYEN